MTNEYILNLENRIHGYHTRLKELHFNAPSISLHKIIDDFDSELLEVDDSIMEDAQAIFGFIEPGDLNPVLPGATEIEDLLIEIRADFGNLLDMMGDKSMWTGIKNVTEDFWHTLNKTIYLVKIAKKEL